MAVVRTWYNINIAKNYLMSFNRGRLGNIEKTLEKKNLL